MKPQKISFSQEPHCCHMADEGEPLVTLELHDGGGGEYLVLHANHWAMDTEAEIDMLVAEMKAMLKGAKL